MTPEICYILVLCFQTESNCDLGTQPFSIKNIIEALVTVENAFINATCDLFFVFVGNESA